MNNLPPLNRPIPHLLNGAVRACPRILLAKLTYRCPLQCPHCSNPVDYARHEQELTTDEWRRVLQEMHALGATQASFSGGEPLARPDLLELIGEARRLGFHTNLMTSAMGLDDARLLALKAAGLDHVQISFQASRQELNDTLAGHHCFVQKLTAARLVKSRGLALTISIVVHRHNLDHLSDLLDFARELHADHVELATLHTIGWAAHNRQHLLPTPEQVLRAKSIIARHEAESPREMHIFHCLSADAQACPRTCLNGGSMSLVAITPDGLALPCAAARDLADLHFPRVREHSLASIWYESEAFRRYRGETELVAHSGGCRCQAWQPGTGVKTTGKAPAETLPVAPWHYRNTKNSMALSESEPVDEDRSTGINTQ